MLQRIPRHTKTQSISSTLLDTCDLCSSLVLKIDIGSRGHAAPERLRALLKAFWKGFRCQRFSSFWCFFAPCHLWWTDSKTSLRYTREGTNNFPIWKRTVIFETLRGRGAGSSSCHPVVWFRIGRGKRDGSIGEMAETCRRGKTL